MSKWFIFISITLLLFSFLFEVKERRRQVASPVNKSCAPNLPSLDNPQHEASGNCLYVCVCGSLDTLVWKPSI